jgi:hypothetical protein
MGGGKPPLYRVWQGCIMTMFTDFSKVFEIFDVDEFNVAYVAEAYDDIHQAKSMLEEALSHARTPGQAHRIQMYLTQVYDELNFI